MDDPPNHDRCSAGRDRWGAVRPARRRGSLPDWRRRPVPRRPPSDRRPGRRARRHSRRQCVDRDVRDAWPLHRQKSGFSEDDDRHAAAAVRCSPSRWPGKKPAKGLVRRGNAWYAGSGFAPAGVAKSADARDSKSRARKGMTVRPRPPAPRGRKPLNMRVSGFESGSPLCFCGPIGGPIGVPIRGPIWWPEPEFLPERVEEESCREPHHRPGSPARH